VEAKSWIFEPTEILIQTSTDGLHFKQIATKKFNADQWKDAKGVNTFTKDIEPMQTRYVRFVAKNRRTCPSDHPGAGGKAWIFINEITVD